jgi:hypothetical protein
VSPYGCNFISKSLHKPSFHATPVVFALNKHREIHTHRAEPGNAIKNKLAVGASDLTLMFN